MVRAPAEHRGLAGPEQAGQLGREHIISRPNENRSVATTTNLAFQQWGSVFHDASCLGALVDRFTQHCHDIDIDGDSYRRRRSTNRGSSRFSSRRKR